MCSKTEVAEKEEWHYYGPKSVFLSTYTSTSARSFYVITNRDKKYSLVQIWNDNLNSTIESQVLSQTVKSKLWYTIYTQFLPITIWKITFISYANFEDGKECSSHLSLITGPWKLHLKCLTSINTVSSGKQFYVPVCCWIRSQKVAQLVRLKRPRKQKQSIMSPNRWFQWVLRKWFGSNVSNGSSSLQFDHNQWQHNRSPKKVRKALVLLSIVFIVSKKTQDGLTSCIYKLKTYRHYIF